MRSIRLFLTLFTLAIFVGCGGGGTPVDNTPTEQLTVGQITGANSINENGSATLSVSASGVTGISYSWSVEPASAGVFSNANSASTTFTANEVDSDTTATIQVTVSASGHIDQIRMHVVTIINVEVIEPPVIDTVYMTDFFAGLPTIFSVSVNGTTPTSYSWNFGGGADPNTSNLAAPEVMLGLPGNYIGSVYVSNEHGDDYMEFGYSVLQIYINPFAMLDGNAVLIADDYTYLGLISSNQFHPDSIMNQYGTYGSPYSATSIFNQYGTYGSDFSSLSPWNQFATRPPLIFVDDVFYAYLTTNIFKTPRVDPYELVDYLS